MRVMHLEAGKVIQRRLISIMSRVGHAVVTYSDYESAIKDTGDYDLYVVGHLNGVHGPDFALDKIMQGKKVLVLAEVQKLSKVPYASYDALVNKETLMEKIDEVMTGGE